jgi:pilus assembly protein Flp/PilA
MQVPLAPPACTSTGVKGSGGREVSIVVVQFFRDDDGQGLVEYALIIAVIAIAVIIAMIFLRGRITNVFSNIGNNLT